MGKPAHGRSLQVSLCCWNSHSRKAARGPYLRGRAAGEPGQLADARRSRGVAGADEDRGADLHGVALLGGLRCLAGHAQRGERVPLLGVLLAVWLFGGRAARGGGQGALPSRDPWPGGLVPLDQLLGCRVKLQSDKRDEVTRQGLSTRLCLKLSVSPSKSASASTRFSHVQHLVSIWGLHCSYITNTC